MILNIINFCNIDYRLSSETQAELKNFTRSILRTFSIIQKYPITADIHVLAFFNKRPINQVNIRK